MGLNNLPESLVKELGEERSNLMISVIEGIKQESSKLERLPANMTLLKDGSVKLGEGRGNTKFATIRDLFTLIQNILNATGRRNKVSWLVENANGEKVIPFVRYGQEEELQAPCVVFKVNKGTPGAFGKGPEHSPSARQRNPALKTVIADPEQADSEIYIMGQRFDYWIEIDVQAETAHEADRMLSWVESALSTNMWYLKYSGVLEFLFSERKADNTKNVESRRIHCRPLNYYVQLEHLSWYRLGVLKDLCLTLELAT